MVSLRLKYVVEDVDRHGIVRIYFRRPGFPKIRLRGLPGRATPCVPNVDLWNGCA
jgi:integrase/recombinase XerD